MQSNINIENINYVFGYFYPEWKLHYDWQNRGAEYQAIIRFFKKIDSKDRLEKAIKELKLLLELGKNFDDEEWYDFSVYNLSARFYPPGIGKTYKEWFEDILRILEEPMEETEKHFIPKFIG